MTPSIRKYVLFAAVAVCAVAGDVWSKHWADTTLATPEHPLPVVIGKGDDGKTLAQVLRERFDLGNADVTPWVQRVRRLDGVDLVDDKTPVFGPGAPKASGYYAFARATLDLPPRRVARVEHLWIEQWVRAVLPDVDVRRIRKAIAERLGKITLADYLAERIPFLDRDEAVEVARDYTWPYFGRPARVEAHERVHAGQVFVVLDRTIDVIPGFFRFTYAENPGAAWGFLAGADRRFRRVFFGLVSVLAVSVILLFVRSLPASDTGLLIAFGLIFGGALGNAFDRLRYEFVVDFIDMYVGRAHWPTYNVADSCITVGVTILALTALVRGRVPATTRGETGARARV